MLECLPSMSKALGSNLQDLKGGKKHIVRENIRRLKASMACHMHLKFNLPKLAAVICWKKIIIIFDIL